MKLRKYLTTVLFLFFFLFTGNLYAQISIAPPALFFDKQNRFSSLIVDNSGQRAQEVTISTYFGYTTSKNGKVKIAKDSVLAKNKSIAEWAKVFPKKFTLQPNQRQTVRFVVHPPQNLDPGGYWTRVQVNANPVSPPLENVEKGKIGAQVALVINQIISAYYHTPGAVTEIEVPSVDFTQRDDTRVGEVAIAIEQTGNAPFIGTVQFSLKKPNGRTVYKTGTTLSVYTTLVRTFDVDLSNIKPGKYIITGKIISERPDLKDYKILQIDPVTFRKKITIE